MPVERWSSRLGLPLATVVCAVPLLVLESTVCRTLRTHVVPAFRSVTPAYAAFGWLVAGSLLPVALLVVVGPRTIGVARPAWRPLVDRPRDDPLGLLVTVAVLLVFAAVGWGSVIDSSTGGDSDGGCSPSTGPTTTCPPSVLGHLLEFQFHFGY